MWSYGEGPDWFGWVLMALGLLAFWTVVVLGAEEFTRRRELLRSGR